MLTAQRVSGARVLVTACLLMVWLSGQATARPSGRRNVLYVTVEELMQMSHLRSRSFDLDMCEAGIRIHLSGRRLNKRNLRLGALDAHALLDMLHEESLPNRMYVWCRTAELYVSLEDRHEKSFEAKDLDHFQKDILLNRHDVDLILAPFFPTQELRTQAFDAARNTRRLTIQAIDATGNVRGPAARRRVKRKMLPWRTQHWPDAIVPYKILDQRLTAITRNSIAEAMGKWEQSTCIRFVETEKLFFQPHIFFRKGSGCSSKIGRQQNGQQISLGTGCESVGVISHEIGHALGLYHEQARPDRDMYVDIIKENIADAFGQFARIKWDSGMTLGVPYDYSSVMHYRSTDFGLNDGEKTTIRAKDPDMQKVMGQREGPSFLDIKLANRNYCSDSCSTGTLDWLECKHEGYRNPNDCNSCVCPRGLAPPRCETPSKGVNDNCGKQVLTATRAEQILKTPGYDTRQLGFNSPAFCPWLITAATPGKRVRLQFTGRFFFTDDEVLCEDYAEVRYKDVSRAGPRLCGENPPERVFRSHGPEMLLSAYSLPVGWWQGFQVIYAEENCGGCSSDASRDEPTCMRTIKYDCSPADCIEEPCPPPRQNYCYRDEEYCCDGLRLVRGRCVEMSAEPPTAMPSTRSTPMPTTSTRIPTTRITRPSTIRATRRPTTPTTRRPTNPTTRRPTTPTTRRPTIPTIQIIFATNRPITTTTTTTTTTLPPIRIIRPQASWSEWSAWSSCSATCGMCGHRSRSRTCLSQPCSGSSVEKEACGSGLCPRREVDRSYTCTRTDPNCKMGWFLRVKKGCQRTTTCTVKEWSKACCQGRDIGGRCQL